MYSESYFSDYYPDGSDSESDGIQEDWNTIHEKNMEGFW